MTCQKLRLRTRIGDRHFAAMWADSVTCGEVPSGADFPVYTAAGGVAPCKQRYVIHVTGGLEPLSAQEVAEVPGCADVNCLLGKVLFSSNAPLDTLRGLRSAEMLSLLCLALPPPAMPGEPRPAQVPDKEGEGEGEKEGEGEGEGGRGVHRASEGGACGRAAEYAAFYAELPPRAAAWLRGLEALVRREMLPALSAAEGVWCAATGHSRSRGIAFRATVNRGGARTKGIGVTSLLMEKIIGGVCSEMPHWRVDLKNWDIRCRVQRCCSNDISHILMNIINYIADISS
jgi:hypothetical protein